MGRSAQTEPPVDVGFIRQSFAVGDGGELQRRVAVTNSAENPVYDNGGGALRVRLTFGGKRRTMDAARVAWALHFGAWPRGQVITLGARSDFSPGNLKIAPRLEHKPHAAGGRASSLTHRAKADRALIEAMIGHSGAAVAELGRIVGASEARTSARLVRLATKGLTQSPQCCPGRSWMLTAQGRAAAIGMSPLIDPLDTAILSALRTAGMGPARLARRCAVSEPTAARRARLLVGRGLLYADMRGFFEVTAAGIEALGDAQPPARWVDPVRISAAAGRDVAARSRGEPDGEAQGVRQIGRPSKYDGALVEERIRA